MTEHLYQDFEQSLIVGKMNESIIAHEFSYQGIPLIQTQGKNDFDFILPTDQGDKTIEVKLDLRSQATGYGCVEWKTVARRADFYLHTFTYCRVYTTKEYERLYITGKSPSGGVGQFDYDARLIKQMGKQGVPLYQFINSLKPH